MSLRQGAVGFRVKSGWTMAVLVAGSATEPVVIEKRVVQLADPAVAESTQPFHAALDLPKPEADATVARLVEVVESFANRSLSEVFDRYRSQGFRIVGSGIVVGSDVNPARIKNDHIRAHAEEGRLFRSVVEQAARARNLSCSVVPEKELFAAASKALKRPDDELKKELTRMGKGIDGAWRMVEKTAALVAWLWLAYENKGSHEPGVRKARSPDS
jgi:hypothetical protein